MGCGHGVFLVFCLVNGGVKGVNARVSRFGVTGSHSALTPHHCGFHPRVTPYHCGLTSGLTPLVTPALTPSDL
ncbi:hypothetical protein GCM10022243_48710 [Saccharothrix violaceirubra]